MTKQNDELRAMIVEHAKEVLQNPNDIDTQPTTFYDTFEQSILDWHNREVERIIGEYSQYPSHYTISDVLVEQRARAKGGE